MSLLALGKSMRATRRTIWKTKVLWFVSVEQINVA
jgi:hypothetical protein